MLGYKIIDNVKFYDKCDCCGEDIFAHRLELENKYGWRVNLTQWHQPRLPVHAYIVGAAKALYLWRKLPTHFPE